ncbi:MAG: hypothetical protein ACTSV7_00620 [Candidatus Baldrarchaeia archaeon]
MQPKNTTSISALKAERKRLTTAIEIFLLKNKLDGKTLTKEDWCLKSNLDRCYLSVILTDKSFKRRISERAAIKLVNAVCRRKNKIYLPELRPDLLTGSYSDSYYNFLKDKSRAEWYDISELEDFKETHEFSTFAVRVAGDDGWFRTEIAAGAINIPELTVRFFIIPDYIEED